MKRPNLTWNLCIIICLLAGLVLTRDALAGGVPQVHAQALTPEVTDKPIDLLDVLILWNTTTQAELDQAAEAVTAAGGVVVATFPNQAMYTRLTAAQLEAIGALPGVRWMSGGNSLDNASLMDVNADLAQGDLGAAVALRTWDTYLQADGTTSIVEHPESPVDDALAAPDSSTIFDPFAPSIQSDLLAETTDAGATKYQTSEYMLGSVQVDVFLPESNGKIDLNLENWTTAQVDQVVGEVTRGVTWWTEASTQGGRPSAGVSFNLVFHTPFNEPGVVATSYEPIIHPYTEQGFWMGEIMARMGYTGDYFDAVRQYTHARRLSLGRDWGFTLWIANSFADTDGRFSDGRFAYAYIYGPIAVMTYDNNGWGVNNTELVLAHEMGHTFGALDEYASSSCTDTQTSGYLNIANTNCENGDLATENSIMRSATNQQIAYPNHQVSTPARGMIGWRDSDTDGIYDPADTTAAINLEVTSPQMLSGEPSWSGMVEEIPYPSPTRKSISLNRIAVVDARVDLEDWWDCPALDGTLDSPVEYFTCEGSALNEGTHYLTVHSQNTAGVDGYATLEIIVQTNAPYFVGLPNFTQELTFPVSWTSSVSLSSLASYDVQYRLDDAAEWTDWLVNTTSTTAELGPKYPGTKTPLALGDHIHLRVRSHFTDGTTSSYQEGSVRIGWGTYLPLVIRP